jgi:hypothetical protein
MEGKQLRNQYLEKIDFDLFREIYQNILSPRIRRSLGEFYTNERIVDDVLDASHITDNSIIDAYKTYETIQHIPLFLDPSCGSGTFLTSLIERIANVLRTQGVEIARICNFLTESIVGIDINPFAVYMTKLNILLKLSQIMHECQRTAAAKRLGDLEEIQRGIVTGTNDLYVANVIKNVKGSLAEVELDSGLVVKVEQDLLYPIVRGRDIDPFTFKISGFIIFTHDSKGNVLCRPDQDEVLSISAQELKKLKSKNQIKTSASGRNLIYAASGDTHKLISNLQASLAKLGFAIKSVKPCAVEACWTIIKGKMKTTISIEGTRKLAKVYIGDLEIPRMPNATSHFLQHMSRLVQRDDYKPGQVPWTIFRVAHKKLEPKLAWQENATRLEAVMLPSSTQIEISELNYSRLLIPLQTVYFIVCDSIRSIQLMLYFNSPLARSFMKLVCWKAQGGFFRHISASMGHLPIPDLSIMLKILSTNTKSPSKQEDLIRVAIEMGIREDEILTESIETSLDLSKEEAKAFVQYSEWLNEVIQPAEAMVEEKSAED